jgi:hypothetical protein
MVPTLVFLTFLGAVAVEWLRRVERTRGFGWRFLTIRKSHSARAA